MISAVRKGKLGTEMIRNSFTAAELEIGRHAWQTIYLTPAIGVFLTSFKLIIFEITRGQPKGAAACFNTGAHSIT